MKHDEKKIEEIINDLPLHMKDVDGENIFYEDDVIEIAKQYAEHMVQKTINDCRKVVDDNFIAHDEINAKTFKSIKELMENAVKEERDRIGNEIDKLEVKNCFNTNSIFNDNDYFETKDIINLINKEDE